MEKTKTIFRVKKSPENPYVMIDRRVIENPNLSWRAKGLLAYLLSRPDNWTIRFRDLVKHAPDGAHTVRASMKELKDAGHVVVTAERDEKGRVKRWTYTVHEMARGTYPDVEFQQVVDQQVDNRTFNNNEYDSKNDSNNNNGADAPNLPADFPPDWQIGHDMPVTQETKRESFLKRSKDIANLIDFQCSGAGELALAFMRARNILLPETKVKGQRKAAREMLEMGVKPHHVELAVKRLIDAKMTVTDLFSVVRTAIDIANPPATSSESSPASMLRTLT